ncbi:BRCA2, helical [Musa troglodytarum]|uniref:BRCA2, helical n=1 Tax=Musa troglodytarum TaxID=320322 RepID=A0A9E7IIE7_9LILI|nr:BRCA2, helical [Musa troglodytarum]
MFRTGTGRAVSVSEFDQEGEGLKQTSGGQDDRFPLFRTGSGKSVTIKESSLRKAAAVLEGNGINKGEDVCIT